MSGSASPAVTVSLIPTIAAAQTFSITLAGTTYNFALNYRDADQAGWVLDISDVNNNPILCGVPLVVSTNLLEQYDYLAFGGALVVVSNGGLNDNDVPLYSELGNTALLYFVTQSAT